MKIANNPRLRPGVTGAAGLRERWRVGVAEESATVPVQQAVAEPQPPGLRDPVRYADQSSTIRPGTRLNSSALFVTTYLHPKLHGQPEGKGEAARVVNIQH